MSYSPTASCMRLRISIRGLATLEIGFDVVVKHFVTFPVNNGFFIRNLEMVVLGIGARGFIFPVPGFITCV